MSQTPYKGPPPVAAKWATPHPQVAEVPNYLVTPPPPPPASGTEAANPKTLMGNLKVSPLSVVPMTALVLEAEAMRYGAFEAPRKDGGKGYGPFNWRDQPIEYLVYADAAIRHIMSAVDREDNDPDSNVAHLAHARATLGILLDAIVHKTVIDNRSKTANGTVARLLRKLKRDA